MDRRHFLRAASTGALIAAVAPSAFAQTYPRRLQLPPVRRNLPNIRDLLDTSPPAITPRASHRIVLIDLFNASAPTGRSRAVTSPGHIDAFTGGAGHAGAFAALELGAPELYIVNAAAGPDGVPDYLGALQSLGAPDTPDFGLLHLCGAAQHLAAQPSRLNSLHGSAIATARNNFAMLTIDAPDDLASALAFGAALDTPDAAAFIPSLASPRGETIGAGLAGAAVTARTDANHGPWQAAAGLSADLPGYTPSVTLSDSDIAQLAPAGINPVRPGAGLPVFWGARTLSTNGDWRYIPVRRLARWCEASVQDWLQDWAREQPNEPALWGAVEQGITDFLEQIWRAGGLQGATSRDAFYVACGEGRTMTQYDIDRGMLIAQFGIAAIRPAEFVIREIEQEMAG